MAVGEKKRKEKKRGGAPCGLLKENSGSGSCVQSLSMSFGPTQLRAPRARTHTEAMTATVTANGELLFSCRCSACLQAGRGAARAIWTSTCHAWAHMGDARSATRDPCALFRAGSSNRLTQEPYGWSRRGRPGAAGVPPPHGQYTWK